MIVHICELNMLYIVHICELKVKISSMYITVFLSFVNIL